MKVNAYHKVNGKSCTDPDCWCVALSDHRGTSTLEDVVNHPEHYQLENLGVEALEIIREILSPEEYKGYLIGNITKYVLRHKKKNNDEDLGKLIFYTKELDKCL